MRWLAVVILVVLLTVWVVTPVIADTDITVTAAPPILAPVVTASSATDITNDSAILHGNITDTEGDNASLRGFEWGLSTGNYTWSWNDTGSFGVGEFEHQATSLSIETHYFWRAYAENEAGFGYSSELDFWTIGLPLAPTNFTITRTGINSINITWVKDPTATLTVIRGSIGGYPESVTEDYLVYSGNGTFVEVEGLSLDFDNYYRAWSWNEYGYSVDYAEAWIGGNTMLLIAVVIIALVLTTLAFVLKHAILHMICVPVWIVLGVLLWNQSWPPENVYLPTAVMLLGISVAIIHLVMTLNHYLGQRTTPPTHDEVQNRFRKRIRDMTHRDRDNFWP